MDYAWQYILQAGGPAAVACLGWWLSGKFQEVKDHADLRLETHEKHDDERFDKAEDLANTRHEQNLRRFGRLGMELMRINPKLSMSEDNKNGAGTE